MGRVAERKLNDFAQQSRKLLLYSHLVVGRRTMHHGLSHDRAFLPRRRRRRSKRIMAKNQMLQEGAEMLNCSKFYRNREIETWLGCPITK